jgi:hypothetical protein
MVSEPYIVVDLDQHVRQTRRAHMTTEPAFQTSFSSASIAAILCISAFMAGAEDFAGLALIFWLDLNFDCILAARRP